MTPHALETKAVVSVFVCLCAMQEPAMANKSETGGVCGTEGRNSEPASEIYSGCSCQPLFLLSLEGSHLFCRHGFSHWCRTCALCMEGKWPIYHQNIFSILCFYSWCQNVQLRLIFIIRNAMITHSVLNCIGRLTLIMRCWGAVGKKIHLTQTQIEKSLFFITFLVKY